MYTEEYQVDYYKANFAVMDEFPCVVGEQAWNFATSQSILRWQATRRASLPATASPSSQLTTSANAGTRSPISALRSRPEIVFKFPLAFPIRCW